jgi:hypothetical protein
MRRGGPQEILGSTCRMHYYPHPSRGHRNLILPCFPVFMRFQGPFSAGHMPES